MKVLQLIYTSCKKGMSGDAGFGTYSMSEGISNEEKREIEGIVAYEQTQEAKKDPDFAPQKVFNIIGYGKTASSPVEAVPFKFLLEKDKSVMNRNKLLSVSQDLINEKKNGYKPPKKPTFKLSGGQVKDKMFQTLENLFKEKKILEHGMEVGKKLAFVLSGGSTSLDKELSEDDLYALEREAFISLIQMEKTQARIKHTLSTGKPLVN